MSEAEMTELRIKAACVVGAKWGFIDAQGYRRVKCLLMPKDFNRGYKPAPEDMPMHEEPLCRLEFNPLEDAADCEALLVTTLSRGYQVASLIVASEHLRPHSGGSADITLVRSRAPYNRMGGVSTNCDPTRAYRQAITYACVAVWEAEGEKGEGE